jgi:hypothetical protein
MSMFPTSWTNLFFAYPRWVTNYFLKLDELFLKTPNHIKQKCIYPQFKLALQGCNHGTVIGPKYYPKVGSVIHCLWRLKHRRIRAIAMELKVVDGMSLEVVEWDVYV